MIKNEKQYNYSKECARKFEYSISVIEKDEAWKERDQEDWQLDIDAKQSHLMALQEEISEYESLVNCDKKRIRSISRGNPNAQQHGANERKVNEEHVPVFADDIALLPPKPLLKRCLVPFAHGK